MANSLTGFSSPNVQGPVLEVLRQNAVFPRLAMVIRDSDGKNRNDTIDLPITSAITARDIAPAITPAANQDMTTSRRQLSLSKWQEATFNLTDKEDAALRDGVLSEQMVEAIKSIGNAIDEDGHLKLYAAQYANVGTPGTTPFSSTSVTALAQARRFLSTELAPVTDRYFVFDPMVEANMMTVGNILQAEQFGSRSGIADGTAGRVLGFDLFVNQNVSTLTADTTSWVTGYSIATGGAAAGATTITVINATQGGAINGGTMFKSASGYYSVYTTVTSTTNTNVALVIQPALATAASSGDAITVVASYTPNIAFHRGALAFASRPLAGALGAEDGNVSQVIDPVTGIALRFAVTREHYQSTVRVSCLWGFLARRPEHIVNIAG